MTSNGNNQHPASATAGGPPPDVVWPAALSAALGGTALPATASAAVLAPYATGSLAAFPVGQRVPIPLVPAQVRPPAPMAAAPRPARARRTLIVVATATALVVVAGLVVVRGSAGTSPHDAVAAYFAALTARDTTQVIGSHCTSNPLCGRDALRVRYEPPQNIDIGKDTGNDDTRQVPVTYTVGGQRTTTAITLRGYSRGTFSGRAWSITEPPGGTLTPPEQTPAPITIAGVELPKRTALPHGDLWAPLGQYTLTRPATPLLDAATTTVTVSDGATVPITVPAVMRANVPADIERFLHGYLDACAAQRSFTPGGRSCPMSYMSRYIITDDPSWTIKAYPKAQLEPADDGSLIITTTAPGSAAITFRWSPDIVEPRGWSTVTDTIEFTLSGRITAANGVLDWQPT